MALSHAKMQKKAQKRQSDTPQVDAQAPSYSQASTSWMVAPGGDPGLRNRMLNRARNIYQQRHPFLPTIPEDDVDGDLNLLEEREYDRTEGLDPELLRERDDQIDQEQARQQRDLENSRRLSR